MDSIIIDNDNFDFATLVEELKDARAAKSAAEKREKEARDRILAILEAQGVSQAMTASGAGVTIQIQHRTSVSGKKLEALYPDIYAQVTSTSAVTVLKTI